jgi:predicted nucleotidyltransferase
MYSIEDRDRIRDLLIEKARADPQIVSAALVGSTVTGGDRWSDLDLTFGVARGVPIESALERWTREVVAEFDAVVLFDLPIPSTIYRVFLLPGALQVDLSFTSEDEFGARSPRFRLLFGHAIERPASPPPAPEHLFGLGVMYVTHANVCIERGRLLQAEHWIHEARYQALTLACARLGLDVTYGRGFGELPSDVSEPLTGALVRDLSVDELRRALAVAKTGLLREARTLPEFVSRVRPMLEDVFG